MEMASLRSDEWARRRATRVGMKLRKMVLHDGETDIDFTQQALCGEAPPPDRGYGVFMTYDPQIALNNLIDRVVDDALSFDAAKFAIGDIITSGEAFPEEVRKKVAAIVTGEIIRPKSKGKMVGATIARDKLILRLILEVKGTFKLDPTSSNRENGTSACHATAEGFRVLGLYPNSYSQMEKIWLKRNALNEFSTDDD